MYFLSMIKMSKNICIAGYLVGSLCWTHAKVVRITSKTTGNLTTLTIGFPESENQEIIKVQQVGQNWQLAEGVSSDYQTKVDATETNEGIRFSIDGINLKLTTSGYYLAGDLDGSLYFEYEGPCKVAKGSRLEITESFFLNESILFENEGELKIGQDWTCLLTTIHNKGKIVVGQGWQVVALQKFVNEAYGDFSMQRADIISPATEVNNRGKIACILDWKGEPCIFNNTAGGYVQIGGNCNLKTLNNKSEFEPNVVKEFKEVKREFFDTKGNLLTQIPGALKNYGGKFRDNSQASNAWIGCKKVLHLQQFFNNKEGNRSSFFVGRDCILLEQSSLGHSDVFIGGKIEIKGSLTIYSTQTLQKITESIFCHQDIRGCRHGFHGHPHYHDYWFADTKTDVLPLDLISSHLEVLGTAMGKIEMIINSKSDTTQPIVIKTTEAKYEQHKRALERLANERGIPLMLLVDEMDYETDLQAMKENPILHTMVRQQELRQARSAVPSGAPSRSLTPDQK